MDYFLKLLEQIQGGIYTHKSLKAFLVYFPKLLMHISRISWSVPLSFHYISKEGYTHKSVEGSLGLLIHKEEDIHISP